MRSPCATLRRRPPAIRRPAGLWGACDVVVRDGGLAVYEVVVIVGLEDGDVDVLTGEGFDVGARRPPAHRHDFGPAVTEVSRPHLGTLVPGCLLVSAQAGSGDVFDVGGRALGADPASPCPGNHG